MSYPVTFEADYVERHNRLTTFFRLILAIPLVIWLYVYAIVAYIVIVIAWFAIVITGRYPRGLYDFVAGFVRFVARFTAYTVLLCDPYPRSVAPTIPPTRCGWSSSRSSTTAA